MDPVSIVQEGEVLYFTDLKRRIFGAAILALRDPNRRWNISEVRRTVIHVINQVFESYAAAAVKDGGDRPYTLPTAWREEADTLISKITQLFFEQQEADEPNWVGLEEKILRLANENSVGMLHLPIFPLRKVSAGMDVLWGPLE